MSPPITLPTEILVEILERCSESHIDILNLCLVHKTWYPIAQSILYRSARLTEHNVPRFFKAMDKYPHLYPLIRSLEFQSLPTLSLEAIQILGSSSNVSSLRLHDHRIDEEQRNILIKSFPQLEKLFILHSVSLAGFSDLAHLISSFPKLKSLVLIDVCYGPDHKESTYQNIDFPMSLDLLRCVLEVRVMDDLLRWMISQNSISPINVVYLGSYDTYGDLPDCIPRFLSGLPNLKRVWVDLSTMWDPPSLTFTENPQLETIRLDFDLWGFNPTKWVPFLSEVFSSVSSVLVETIVITLRMTGGCAPNFDWVALGNVLSSSMFTKLRAVYITCTHPCVLEEPPYVGDLEDKIREALAHLVAKDILTVQIEL